MCHVFWHIFATLAFRVFRIDPSLTFVRRCDAVKVELYFDIYIWDICIYIYIYIYVESTGDCGGAFAAVHVVCCCACGSLFCFHVYYIMLLAAASNPIRQAYTLSSTTGACLLVF